MHHFSIHNVSLDTIPFKNAQYKNASINVIEHSFFNVHIIFNTEDNYKVFVMIWYI